MFPLEEIIKSYPPAVRSALLAMRALILHVADAENLGAVEESLKWGQASYTVKGGSPIRLGWKQASANEVALYFHCQTILVETFREVYGDLFRYEGNRALVFTILQPIPNDALKHCVLMAFRYHKIKHLPLLGA